MILLELFDPAKPGYQSDSLDNSTLKINDTRKTRTRLTFADLNRLRMANDVRKVEFENNIKNISSQYKPPAQAPAAI